MLGLEATFKNIKKHPFEMLSTHFPENGPTNFITDRVENSARLKAFEAKLNKEKSADLEKFARIYGLRSG